MSRDQDRWLTVDRYWMGLLLLVMFGWLVRGDVDGDWSAVRDPVPVVDGGGSVHSEAVAAWPDSWERADVHRTTTKGATDNEVGDLDSLQVLGASGLHDGNDGWPLAAQEARSFWARRVALERSEDGLVGEGATDTQPVLSVAAERTAGDAGATGSPDRINPSDSGIPWRPADECSRVPNTGPVWITGDTWRWCEYLAETLYRTGKWEPGDLRHLMLLMECESNGDPSAVNPASGTAGLFQHRPRYWSARAAASGVSNPDPLMPYDNIVVAVWLYTEKGAQHWDGCGPKIASTLAR